MGLIRLPGLWLQEKSPSGQRLKSAVGLLPLQEAIDDKPQLIQRLIAAGRGNSTPWAHIPAHWHWCRPSPWLPFHAPARASSPRGATGHGGEPGAGRTGHRSSSQVVVPLCGSVKPNQISKTWGNTGEPGGCRFGKASDHRFQLPPGTWESPSHPALAGRSGGPRGRGAGPPSQGGREGQRWPGGPAGSLAGSLRSQPQTTLCLRMPLLLKADSLGLIAFLTILIT